MVRPPLIVDNYGEISFFRDPAGMEVYLEAIDVENEEYIVYDSEGRIVRLTTAVVPRRAVFGLVRSTLKVVRAAGCESEPRHAEELSAKLRAFLERYGIATSPQATLSDLIEDATSRFGFAA